MRISPLLWAIAQFLCIPSFLAPLYIYFYPVVQLCRFPDAKPAQAACYFDETHRPAVPSEEAPFRLLALGDPQLEGDTSLPDPNAPVLPSLAGLRNGDVRGALTNLFASDLPKVLQAARKRVDLWGNDLYLAHIYRSVKWWTVPTHVVVLGDLLGSQWIGDGEFARRSERFWKIVFKGGRKVPDRITGSSGRRETLGADDEWASRVIAVAGNHDIGYAGDIDKHRIERFERAFGGVNWEIRFTLNDSRVSPSPAATDAQQTNPHHHLFSGSALMPSIPELRLVVLNSMNLDGPAHAQDLQQQSLDFMRQHLDSSRHQLPPTTGTVLLTHIPLHKDAGICVDGPLFEYFEPHQGAGIREQNHLSAGISAEILMGLLGPDGTQQAVIVNGHDHWGCDVYHHRASLGSASVEDVRENPTEEGEQAQVKVQETEWRAKNFLLARHLVANESVPGLREVTARSMMGSFGGNAVLLSAWFDREEWRWKFDYNVCFLGVQHMWWAAHVLVLVDVGLFLAAIAAEVFEALSEIREEKRKHLEAKQKAAKDERKAGSVSR